MSIKILVNGAAGRMGKTAVIAIENDSAVTLVGAAGKDSDLVTTIANTKPDVVVDLTTAHSVYKNSLLGGLRNKV